MNNRLEEAEELIMNTEDKIMGNNDAEQKRIIEHRIDLGYVVTTSNVIILVL